MPLFIQMTVYWIIVWFMAKPFLNLIDEYNEKKEAEEKEKKSEDFDWDWLEEIIREERER